VRLATSYPLIASTYPCARTAFIVSLEKRLTPWLWILTGRFQSRQNPSGSVRTAGRKFVKTLALHRISAIATKGRDS
jgi:hypothetical protein